MLTERFVTVRFALTFAAIVRPWVLVIFAGVTVFVTVPGVLLVTQTSRIHVDPAGNSGAKGLLMLSPIGAMRVRAAGQPVKVGPAELLTVTPAGRLSVIKIREGRIRWGGDGKTQAGIAPAVIVPLVKLFVNNRKRVDNVDRT